MPLYLLKQILAVKPFFFLIFLFNKLIVIVFEGLKLLEILYIGAFEIYITLKLLKLCCTATFGIMFH